MWMHGARLCLTLCGPQWTVVCQAFLSMGFSRKEYWIGLTFPPLGGSSQPGMEPASLESPELAGGFFTSSTIWEALYERIRSANPYSHEALTRTINFIRPDVEISQCEQPLPWECFLKIDGGLYYHHHHLHHWRDENVLELVMVLYNFTNIPKPHWIVYFKGVNCIVCELCLINKNLVCMMGPYCWWGSRKGFQ